MDPDLVLEQILDAARTVLAVYDKDEPTKVDVENLEASTNTLANGVLALDEWLAKGGFTPSRWNT